MKKKAKKTETAKFDEKVRAIARAAREVKSRIVGEGSVHPKKILANPANWRKHAQGQREAMREILQTIGWVQRVIVNKRTGRLVDGHMRVEEAAEMGLTSIPCVYIDVSEAEERTILATLDPISAAAGMDAAKLKAVLDGFEPETAGLQALIADLEASLGVGAVDGGDGDGEVLLDQSVQLSPGREYVVVLCETEEDFTYLREMFGLRMVRRGGYKKGSPFDDVGIERVLTVKRVREAIHEVGVACVKREREVARKLAKGRER